MCTEARGLRVRTTESVEGQSGQGSVGAKASAVARVPCLRKRELLVLLDNPRVTREARARGGGQDPLPSAQLVWSCGPYWRCMSETWSSLLCAEGMGGERGAAGWPGRGLGLGVTMVELGSVWEYG